MEPVAMPEKPLMFAKCSVKTAPVLPEPALTMSQTASTTKTTTSKVPRMVPVLALSCTPRKLSRAITRAAAIMNATQVAVKGQLNSLCVTEAIR